MEKFAYDVVIHETVDGFEVATRVRTEHAVAYAALLQAETFIKPNSVRVLTINPASKRTLALLGV